MTETELENFSPRNAIVLVSRAGNSVTWDSFTVGSKNVRRITVNEYGLVRVEWDNGQVMRAMGSDWSGMEAVKAPAPPVTNMVGSSPQLAASLSQQGKQQQGKRR